MGAQSTGLVAKLQEFTQYIWSQIKSGARLAWQDAERIGAVVGILLGFLAIIISTKAIDQGSKAISLANESLKISQDARNSDDLKTLIERAPYITIFVDTKAKSVFLQNVGFGPANIYQVDINTPEGSITIDSNNHSDPKVSKIEDLFGYRAGSFNPLWKNIGFYYQDPFRTIAKETQFAFQEFNLFEGTISEFWEFIKPVTYRICYTDLLGKIPGETRAGPYEGFPKCPVQPSIISVTDGMDQFKSSDQ